MQIIVVYESGANPPTDYLYFRTFVDAVYDRLPPIHWSPIGCGSKNNYAKVRRSVTEKVRNYAFRHPKEPTFVICAFDTDDGREGARYNEGIQAFCASNGYELVWMHRDVEEVFLQRSLTPKEKVKEAKRYATCPHEGLRHEPRFSRESFHGSPYGVSNLRIVMDRVFTRCEERPILPL